jgi:hypothetical protein
MNIIPLLVSLSLTVLAAQSVALQKQKQVLVDFRLTRTDPPLKIPAATERAVLSKLFRRYLTDEARCSADFDTSNASDTLKAARDAGQIVPSIIDMTTGSFTASGQTQTAYVIFVSECNAPHALNFGSKRIAIFSGQQLVADIDLDFKMNIVRKTDLNSDGIDELLMTGGDMNQGTITEVAALLSFQNRRLRVIEDFSTVHENSCATGIQGSSVKASVISISDVVPGQMPKLRVENYESGCRKVKRWRFLSTGLMP